VAAAGLPREIAEFAAASAGGLATAPLTEDAAGWFASGGRADAIQAAFRAALAELTQRLGSDMERWTWGRLHTLVQKHFLAGRGDLGQLFDRSGLPVRGDHTTVCNTSPDADHAAALGASYRMVTDQADSRPGLWAVEVGSVSGRPGSPHYDDQVEDWVQGDFHYLSLDGYEKEVVATLTLGARP
jgi:penicillin amidase